MRTKINYYDLQPEKLFVNEKDNKPISHDIFKETQPTTLSVGIQDCLTEFINGKQPDSHKNIQDEMKGPVIIEDVVEQQDPEKSVLENNIEEADFTQSDKPKLYKNSILSQFKNGIKFVLKGICLSFIVFVTIAAILQFFN